MHKYYIQDCYILYKSIEKNLKSLLQIQKNKEKGNNKINSFNIKVIYSIIFFILSQFIRLINIPNSMNKNNEDILDYIINSIDEKSGEYLSTINISNFILHNNNSIKSNIQYLKEILLKNENKDSFFINYNTLKQILDIIFIIIIIIMVNKRIIFWFCYLITCFTYTFINTISSDIIKIF